MVQFQTNKVFTPNENAKRRKNRRNFGEVMRSLDEHLIGDDHPIRIDGKPDQDMNQKLSFDANLKKNNRDLTFSSPLVSMRDQKLGTFVQKPGVDPQINLTVREIENKLQHIDADTPPNIENNNS